MTQVKDRKMKVITLTNYLIDLHSPQKSAAFILLIPLIAGLIGSVAMGGLDGLAAGAEIGLLFIAVPALLAGFFTTALTSLTKKELNLRRSFYLAFFNATIISVLYLIGAVMQLGMYQIIDIIVYGYVLSFIIRSFLLKVAFPYSAAQSILLGSLQPAFACLALLNATMLLPGLSISLMPLLLKILVSLIIFAGGTTLFALLINAPMKRNFGINSFGIVNAFLENWFDQSDAIEKILKSIGEKTSVLIGLISFKAKNRIKTLLIVPYVHPGPFGEVGGGKLTRVLMERLEHGRRIFIPHGAANHDLNPITTASLHLMADSIGKSLKDIKYYKTASHSIRAQNADVKLIGQRFGNSVFLASTLSPEATEDIDFSIGLAVMNQLKEYDNVVYADCHNCHRPGYHAIHSGNPIVFDLLDGVKQFESRMAEENDYRIKAGLGMDPLIEYSSIDGIGPMGLRVLVIEANGQKTAYVLFDANNIVAGMRERIIAEIKKLGLDEVEVMTTDSHCVNNVRGVENPLGMKIDKSILVKRAVAACRFALADLEPVEVGSKIIRVDGIDVFGPQRSIELVSMVNTMIAIMKIVAPLIFIASLSLSLLAVFAVGW
jgi:putative membrane protein